MGVAPLQRRPSHDTGRIGAGVSGVPASSVLAPAPDEPDDVELDVVDFELGELPAESSLSSSSGSVGDVSRVADDLE